MATDDNQGSINSPNENDDQPERFANDPSERGASGSVPAPEGVGAYNIPPKIDNINPNPNPLIKHDLEKCEGRILRAGIDSLTLSIYCEWEVDREHQEKCKRLDQFKELKLKAMKERKAQPGKIEALYGGGSWLFNMQTFRVKNYELVLIGVDDDFSIRITKRDNIGNQPRVQVEFRSKYLHATEIEKAVSRARAVLRDIGLRIRVGGILVSVLHLHCDYLDINGNITSETRNTISGKAGVTDLKEKKRHCETIYIGSKKDPIQLVIYDKKIQLKEINAVGSLDKEWNLNQGEEDYTIYRIEYHLRRKACKDLGVDKVESLYHGLESIWSYLTKEWCQDLEVDDTHKNRQVVKSYWKEIQQAFVQKEDGPVIKKQERSKLTVTNPWLSARGVYKALIKFLAECIVTATRLPEEITVQMAIEAWAKFVVWIPDMNNEDFEARVKEEVGKIRNRKEEEKAKILKKAKSIINLNEKYAPHH